MKWARNISGVVAVVSLLLWLWGAFVGVLGVGYRNASVATWQSALGLCWSNSDSGLVAFPEVEILQSSGPGPGGCAPSVILSDNPRFVILPHWFTNLIAWSAFLYFWRKACKPAAGHCPQCGYNLTGNVSGHCPECHAKVPE